VSRPPSGPPPPELTELLTRLHHDLRRGDHVGTRACQACVDYFPVSAAGVMLTGDHGNASVLGASDDRARALEDLQFTLGEGPGIEAHVRGRPVLEHDLAHDVVARRSMMG
jgi:hypothetical protein